LKRSNFKSKQGKNFDEKSFKNYWFSKVSSTELAHFTIKTWFL